MQPVHEPMKAVDPLAAEVAGLCGAVAMNEVLEALRAGVFDALVGGCAADAAFVTASGEEADA